MTKTKDEWRQELQGEMAAGSGGKVAEVVRRQEAYRRSHRIFVSPAPALSQLRINALLDGKELIMPGPGLKEGFYRLRPFVTPLPKLGLAVSLKGVSSHGQLIYHHDLAGLAIDLLLTEAVAVDGEGHRLGDGSGFFDLSCAILNHCRALTATPTIWAVAVSKTTEPLPSDPWDVRVHGLLEPQGLTFFSHQDPLPSIDWRQLPMPRIKKVTPLWKEWERHQGTPPSSPSCAA